MCGQQLTLKYYDCLDLETRAVFPDSASGCSGNWDFYFGYSNAFASRGFFSLRTGVQVALSAEAFDDVTAADVASLSFTSTPSGPITAPVAVIRTALGNYFKLSILSQSSSLSGGVKFRWHWLDLP